MTTDPFTVGDTDVEHDPGDPECGACWSGFPDSCQDPDCDGLIHASFGDETEDGYWLYFKCDKCGGCDYDD